MLNADLFKGLAPAETDRLLALGQRILLTSGAELFHLGDAGDRIFIIARGRIRLTLPMHVRSREENVLVEECSPGQTVGWSGLIPPHRFTLTASAPLETEVIAFARGDLDRDFAAHPETARAVSLNLATVIGQRLQLFQAMWLREIQRMVESRCA